MLRNIAIAVLLASLFILCVDQLSLPWWDMQIYFDDDLLSPVATLLVVMAVGAFFVAIGVLVALSLASIVLMVLALVFGALLMAGIGAFWPWLLMALVVIWLVKDKRHTAQ
ncbi:hypothetical protein P2G88_18865 [Aliiglaciecola sp. CAU 1673]|uniref:hypothetical protein n=1 Tax=Aliiglaciecola sp. CAU 1673 TaxID=3032595 RepID=UPI0023D99239|nr:hypothetical protein [Aliiglaciecola sp. CAU 1673]MDF2180324.1 hypothetical protein [Aliiglaciecola sp. CAU 1673]